MFLSYIGVENIDDMNYEQYAKAINSVNKKG